MIACREFIIMFICFSGGVDRFHQFTHTVNEVNPFWSVDLGEVFHVDRIIIYNRIECCMKCYTFEKQY